MPSLHCQGAVVHDLDIGASKHEGGTIQNHVSAREVAFWDLLELRN